MTTGERLEGFTNFVTDFADAGVVVPVFLASALVLVLQGRRRPAFAWCAVIGGTWLAMVLLKLLGYAGALLWADPGLDLVTSSGHVASAAAGTGGLVWLASGSRRGAWIGAIAVAVVIGMTRVMLGAHSLAEVVIGGAVGLAGAGTMISSAAGGMTGRARFELLGAVGLVLVAFHGRHFTIEAPLQGLAGWAVSALGAPAPP